MTKSTITREQAHKIIVAADEVITALAGTNEDVHPDDSKKMCELWDDLNDRYAPPVVVRELAHIALATLASEPVAEVRAYYPLGIDGGKQKFIQVTGELPDFGTQLYVIPQPAPVATSEEHRQLRDLVMMVKMLCRTVRKYTPESQQAANFTAYLQKEGLISAADCLRDSDPLDTESEDRRG